MEVVDGFSIAPPQLSRSEAKASGRFRFRSQMPISEIDLHRIRHWCDARVPRHLWTQLKVEADVTNIHVTLVSVRPHFQRKNEKTRVAFARLRFVAVEKIWRLYWVDRNRKFHVFDPAPRSKSLQALLDTITRDETGIFFG
ncbi:MAG: DUF3024 domain-containing protein [Archangium sp.]